MNKRKEILELREKLKHKGYFTQYFKNYSFYIGKGTLGPEMSWVAHLLSEYLLQNNDIYSGKEVLEIGAGSGIQSVIMALNGAKKVVATDISKYAISSIEKNKELFNLSNLEVLASDLFEGLETIQYDLILFNHPFINKEPEDLIEGIYCADKKQLKSFFSEVRNFLKSKGEIIMPFSSLGNNNPSNFARMYGFLIQKFLEFNNEHGKQMIYTFISS
ncbi:methyltransferase [Bacteroidota bacterium]